jgi:hypothetical protein
VLLLVPVRTGSGRSPGRAPGGVARGAGTFGRSQPLATLSVGQPLSAEQTEALRFNPWTTGPGIHPSGWLNLLRDAAYRASQRGRRG